MLIFAVPDINYRLIMFIDDILPLNSLFAVEFSLLRKLAKIFNYVDNFYKERINTDNKCIYVTIL